MTSTEKKIALILLGICSVLAAVYVAIWLSKRMAQRERYKLIALAAADRLFWSGKYELEAGASSTLKAYWRMVGVNLSSEQLQSPSIQSKWPWSAAYISSLVLRSGYKNFKGRASHSLYVIDAKNHRAQKLKPSYWAFSPNEGLPVDIGDILVAGRSGSNPNLQTIEAGVNTHGDIVIDVKKEHGNWIAFIQGGNVSNTVTMRSIALTDKKTLPKGTKFFAQLKYIK